ncbi:MAG: peptidylprolyl isomerase [Verrucomicrobia bacterium]|nr:peptidylprolyl isomerase [Verrucomicrobiota bacterium]MCF7708156.1 peptidylprolyl isomerase [Verrucomicrobiota bacterium]
MTQPNQETSESTNEVAIIETNYGDMIVSFWPESAPNTVANFKKLARDGFYDGTLFHRIIDGFMIQGGDPLTKDPSKKQMWGTGDPGYTIDAEFNEKSHQLGVISMARGADPNSAGSQFFICLGDASNLDGQYTAFGELVDGIDVLQEIGNVPVTTNAQGKESLPEVEVKVEKISIHPVETIQNTE